MKKILVIEDEKALLEEVGEILTFEGYDVLLAENGKEGVDIALNHSPDLILCDIMMPVMDGKRVIYELKAAEKTTMIPFVFMSALAERQSVRDGMVMGADDYLTKPFTHKDLLETINTQFKKLEIHQKTTNKAIDSLCDRIITVLPDELRSPLSSIIGAGGLLNDISDILTPHDISRLGGEILNAGNRLYRLIENYLIYVQLEINKHSKYGVTDQSEVKSLIKETATLLGGLYQRKDDIDITIDSVADIAIADNFFRKIMLEVIDNALKFSSVNSSVFILVGVENENLCVKVSDQGRGIQLEQISQINAFTKLSDNHQAESGAGLGLYITNRMLSLSGGHLEIKSQPGNGTEVSMLFPLK